MNILRKPVKSAYTALLAVTLLVAPVASFALSNQQTSSGIKEAINSGINYAIDQLGKQNGFSGNPNVKITLPDSLGKINSALSMVGLGKYGQKIEDTMNQAAEQSVAEAKPILVSAVKKMSLSDVSGLLTGGDDAITQYFRKSSSTAIAEKFLPIISRHTEKLNLSSHYNQFIGFANKMGLTNQPEQLDQYVTNKAVDGLFTMIAAEEKKIRENPLESGSKLLKTIFGSLGK